MRYVFVLGLLFPLVAQAADKTQLDPGEEAPPFRLKVLNADKAKMPMFDVSDYLGAEAAPENKKKMVMLSFFATYCEPCKKELPFLAALNEEYGDKGLQIVSISIDKEDDKIAQVKELIEKNKLIHPVLSDRYQAVAKRFYVAKLPCLYMLDGERAVSKVAIGYDDNAMREVVADVRKALGLNVADPLPPRLAAFVKGPAGKPVAEPPTAAAEKKPKKK